MAEEMKIEIISRETLKPSSPTPNHLKHYKLSLLDQLVRLNVYTTKIFFNPNNHNFPTSQALLVLNRLKESLSKALTRFYPLAGRFKGNAFIDCRDDGAPFIEARSHGFLSMFLRNLDNEKLPEPFLPPKSDLSKRLSPPQLHVQAAFFACGGLAVGLYMSHKFGDGGTFSRFVKDWTFLSRGGHSQTLLPALDFTASSSFPPSVSAVQPPTDEAKRFAVSGDKCITKRFVFDEAKIAALKVKATVSTGQWRGQPTRAEAITALIWRCATSAARRTNKGFPLHFVKHQLVNIRKRIELPFSENTIGNFVQYFSVEIDNQETKTMELQDLVALLRKGIEGFDEGEAKRLG
ncbi:hypothetical protein FNV43_RR20394 [Rhamnella rubrinervis]|uniref:Uncharacterized protein n=1 Tax=Rhamnella rubrinervis TaxID=2594499 RepID=A0A8K0GUJ1_9ROSA|nr:hypothetical protein FNV43_RR20394 [Rhamnella rubrinervis]